MQGTPDKATAQGLRRSKLALSALRAALEDLRPRIAPLDRGLCDLALERLLALHAELEALEPRSPRASVDPAAAFSLGELCHAARQSLSGELQGRVLVALEQTTDRVVLEGPRTIQSLRRLLRAMFACGAGAVLLHGHLDDHEAVFAILDDQQLFDPTRPEGAADYATACQEIEAMEGRVTPIGTPSEPQGLIVCLPVRLASEQRRAAGAASFETGVIA